MAYDLRIIDLSSSLYSSDLVVLHRQCIDVAHLFLDQSQLSHVGRISIVAAVANAAEPARIAVDIGEAHLVAAGLASYGDQQRARILAYQATGAIEQVVDVGGVGGYPPVEVLPGGANVVVVRRGASVGAVVEHRSEERSVGQEGVSEGRTRW